MKQVKRVNFHQMAIKGTLDKEKENKEMQLICHVFAVALAGVVVGQETNKLL